MSGVDLSPGEQFGGDFRIERELSEGGMGTVYVAEQVSTGKRRALKVMKPQLVTDARSRARFIEEAKVGARIESAHVVEVIGAGVDEVRGAPWLAMELLSGQNLEDYLTSRGPLPLSELAGLYAQIAHALGQAHAQGIIHRDLKPENLFLAQDARVGASPTLKILDFGIATFVASDKTAATVTSAMGSPLWIAPEQAQTGARLRPATDVWALGLIAFYLLTGKSYWPAANAEPFNLHALIAEILSFPLPPASQRAAELGAGALPPGFDGWFARCVVRDLDARFADASAASAALSVLVGGAVNPYAATGAVSAPAWAAPSTGLVAGSPFASGVGASSGASPFSSAPPVSAHPQPMGLASAPPSRVAPASSGSSAPLVIGCVGLFAVVALAGALGALSLAAWDGGAPRDGDPRGPGAPAPRPVVDPRYRAALEACRVALERGDTARAIAEADVALQVRPGDPAASDCRGRASAARSAAADPPGAVADASGRLDSADAQRVVREGSRSLRACYQRALRERPELAGRVDVRITVGPGGRVTDQRIEPGATLDDPEVQRCILSRVQAWRFPRPEGGHAELAVPLIFRPNAERNEEPSAAPELDDAAVGRCMMVGDNACVVDQLEGRAHTERHLAMLIEAYRALGREQDAARHMRTYVERFPRSGRAREYQRLLDPGRP